MHNIQLNIKQRLILICLAVATVTLLLASGVFISNQIISYRESLIKQLISAAQTIEVNVRASLVFQDREAASQNLENLSVLDHLRYAVILDQNGVLMAEYNAGTALTEQQLSELANQELLVSEVYQGYIADSRYAFSSGYLKVRLPISLDGEDIGNLELYSDTTPVEQQTQWIIMISVAVLMGSLLFGYFLSVRLQRTVSGPLAHLLNSMKLVTRDRNYEQFVTNDRTDEIGDLIDAFNEMLGEVRNRDEALARSNLELEKKVAERTAEIQASNQALEIVVQRHKKAKEDAEKASHAKGDFLATMTHELRTPMNGVLGMLHLVRDTELDEKQKNYVDMAENSGKILLELINNVLDYSKIEAGMLEMEEVAFDLREVILDTVNMFYTRAAEKKIVLKSWVPEVLEHQIVGDPMRLRQVLINLVGNAIKFTDEGEVSLRAEITQVQENHLVIEFSVSDTGVGISAEQQAKVFEEFAQADSSINRRYGGTGLGLAISKRIIETLGGELLLHSEVGKGTKFSFSIQFEKTTSTEEVVQDKRDGAASFGGSASELEVLLVEDDKINQMVAQALLEDLSCKVTLAENGVEALDRFSRNSFELVFMDCFMPDVDGLQATRDIRQLEQRRGRARTPIVALTANIGSEIRDKCLAAGMDEFLSKPIMQEQLQQILQKFRDGKSAPNPSTLSR